MFKVGDIIVSKYNTNAVWKIISFKKGEYKIRSVGWKETDFTRNKKYINEGFKLFEAEKLIEKTQLDKKLRELDESQKIMEDYLLLKFKEKDFHGVSDAANDIRDIVAAREVLKEIL